VAFAVTRHGKDDEDDAKAVVEGKFGSSGGSSEAARHKFFEEAVKTLCGSGPEPIGVAAEAGLDRLDCLCLSAAGMDRSDRTGIGQFGCSDIRGGKR
jgi:hypothetical protein